MQRNSLLTARLHRLHFYVVLRKLIAELQAFSQCIKETPMVRFYSKGRRCLFLAQVRSRAMSG